MQELMLIYAAEVMFFLSLAALVWLWRSRLLAYVERTLRPDADIGGSEDFYDAGTLALMAGALTAFLVTMLGWHLAIAGGAGLVVAAATPPFLRGHRRRRYVRAFEESLIESLTTVASSLRAGLTLREALYVAANNCPAAFAREAAYVLKQYRLGMPIEEALDEVRRRVPTANSSIGFGAMIIASQLGGNLPETLARIVVTIRERDRVEGKLRSLTSQGRAQAFILCSAPPAIGVVMFLYDPRKMELFFTTFSGQLLLTLAIVLELLGIFATSKVMRLEI